MRPMRCHRGVTLIEMVIVIAITAIIATGVAVFISRPFEGYIDAARRAELSRSIETAQQQVATNEQSAAQLQDELAQLTDASAQAGLQEALALKVERETALGAKRSEYDDLSLRLRRADEQRLAHEQSESGFGTLERTGRVQIRARPCQTGIRGAVSDHDAGPSL